MTFEVLRAALLKYFRDVTPCRLVNISEERLTMKTLRRLRNVDSCSPNYHIPDNIQHRNCHQSTNTC